MGFSEKQKFFEKNHFLPKFWWFLWFFLFLGYIWDFENLKKSSKFRKIGRKSSFGVSIDLNHLVSETTSLSGHFGVFTTHITNFFTKLGSHEEAHNFTEKLWKSESKFTESAWCKISFRAKLKSFKNNLLKPFCSKFNVDTEKIRKFEFSSSRSHFIAFWKSTLDFSWFFGLKKYQKYI